MGEQPAPGTTGVLPSDGAPTTTATDVTTTGAHTPGVSPTGATAPDPVVPAAPVLPGSGSAPVAPGPAPTGPAAGPGPVAPPGPLPDWSWPPYAPLEPAGGTRFDCPDWAPSSIVRRPLVRVGRWTLLYRRRS